MLSPGLMTTELGFSTRPVSGRGRAVLAGGLGGGGGGGDPPPVATLARGRGVGGGRGPVWRVASGVMAVGAVSAVGGGLVLTVAVTVCGPAFVAVQVERPSGQEPSGVMEKKGWSSRGLPKPSKPSIWYFWLSPAVIVADRGVSPRLASGPGITSRIAVATLCLFPVSVRSLVAAVPVTICRPAFVARQ